ncbi:hypothetical protein CLAFUW4_08272 [Fulvia fulva]|uniref:Uncharacterized protein n=1 Tax=Passalora fulva TaxID=5499 RepID=A0A9Q8LCB6_PASFU|nr:uncharacterized protein CLAFUR5_08381 [Fulvia fulva]KAK4629348.1 hypothetical protein CLAFUR4_08277 [Fulvia fulva]KAK4630188.1 hypothetical protein CLAFUR0_08272 [Fulvia fulva]UJO14771.1 hypothetical protein CLAFUR5_08381 [Fulvia fulva]WPV12806.1 hypothetical protein CLAFUW4_08272 [Fulvia fulva]WPV27780.1 hypothetical protein CLAFUW7_08272 [Fulvia fulva]
MTPLKHFLAALGLPASAFSKGNIPTLPPRSAEVFDQQRKIVVTSAMMRESAERHRSGKHREFLRGELIETVLTAITAKSSERGNAAQHSASFTPLELLTAYKCNLIADEPHINFNYFGFWQMLWDVYVDIFLALAETHSKYRFQVQPNKGLSPHKLVYDILLDAGKSVSQSKPLAGTPISTVAAVLDCVIKTQGNDFSTEAFSESSGRIPKSKRPEFRTFKPGQDVDIFTTLLAQDPASKMYLSGAHRTVYDPNGSHERHAQIMETCKPCLTAVRDASKEDSKVTVGQVLNQEGSRWRFRDLQQDSVVLRTVQHVWDD